MIDTKPTTDSRTRTTAQTPVEANREGSTLMKAIVQDQPPPPPYAPRRRRSGIVR